MSDQYPEFKAAAVQAASVFLDREKSVEKACSLIVEASDEGAELIVFPESFIPGHPYWFRFYTIPVSQRKFYARLFKNAVEIPSPSINKLSEAAKEADIYVVMGLTEKEKGTMGTMYNSQIFFGPAGNILGKHRKIVPSLWERIVHSGGDGDLLRVFPTRFGEIGGLICGEHTNSLARFALLAQGEKIHAASWPALAYTSAQHFPEDRIYREGALLRSRYHAYEGRVFVICATGYFDDSHREVIFGTKGDNEMIVGGGGFACIIDPVGRIISSNLGDKEGIVYADIRMEDMIEPKGTFDLVGHYNRPDIFTLVVNRSRSRLFGTHYPFDTLTQIVDPYQVLQLRLARGDIDECRYQRLLKVLKLSTGNTHVTGSKNSKVEI